MCNWEVTGRLLLVAKGAYVRAMKKLHVLALTPALALLACAEAKKEAPKEAAAPVKAAEAVALKTDKGVDAATKTIRLGALNDESGPAAAIGKPYAWGKRILAAEVNAGGSGVLPEGWKVELIEKDHGYNPGKAQQAYESIKDDVLAIATSFGTPATLPLRPFLKRDTVVAFPASLSSQMAEYEFTPPAGPSYVIEARRAMDWVLTTGDKGAIKPAIIYDQTDYGKDGIVGWQKAAKQHGIEIVAERAVKPGQKDFTADITALKKAGATHVLHCPTVVDRSDPRHRGEDEVHAHLDRQHPRVDRRVLRPSQAAAAGVQQVLLGHWRALLG